MGLNQINAVGRTQDPGITQVVDQLRGHCNWSTRPYIR